jgi:type IVB pilus formation R64 PilN family outer membrane protein
MTRDARAREEEVDKPFLVGKPVPLARDVSLPASLRADAKIAILLKAGRVSLPVAAQRITLATGIPVKIEPDVYLDRSSLLPKGQDVPATAGAAPIAGANSVPVAGAPMPSPLVGGSLRAPATTSLASPYEAGLDTPYDFQFDPIDPLTAHNPTAAGVCDLIATRLGINWEYDDAHGVIRFYRMVTRTWQIPVSPALTSYTTAFEGSNHQTTNQAALQTTSSDTAPVKSESSGTNELDSVKASIATVMTRSGNVAVNNATGTITLTDTKQSVDAAEQIIRTQVAILSRVVMLRIRTVQVTTTDDGESGIDWNAILTKALQHFPAFSLTALSPASLVSGNAGSIGLNILSGTANGTQAIIQALGEIGRVQTSTELPLATRNRHPIFYNVRNEFSYVSGTTPATATAGGTGGIPGITTAQDEVGTKIMIYPNATSRNDVVLTVALDQSVLQSLQSFSSGSGSNVQTVQLPNVNGEGSTQEVPIRSGQTLVLTGFDRIADQYDKRTLGSGIPLLGGGSMTANRTRTTTIVLVSVVVSDPNS